MANLTITPANVLASGAIVTNDRAGESVVTGQMLYQKTSDLLWYKADALTAEKAGSSNAGRIMMAMNTATVGQPVTLLNSSQSVTLGAIGTLGRLYVISATTGLICPIADLVTGNYLSVLGYFTTTSIFQFQPMITGTVTP